MRGTGLAVVAALACGCAFPAAKSRIEPQERVLIEMSADAPALSVPDAALDPHELSARFAALLKRDLIKRRSLAPNRTRADALLAVRLIRVSLEQKAVETAALRITAAARVETGGDDPGKPRGAWQASEYEGAARPRSEWSDVKVLDGELGLGLERLAGELVAGAIRSKETK